MSGIFGLVMTDAARIFPRHSGTVFGLLIAGVATGALIVPAVMGYVADVSGLRIAMLAPAALMAAVSAIYAAAPPPPGPPGETG
jgi:fucose permease